MNCEQIPCCDAFRAAMQGGSDNEGYGALVYVLGPVGSQGPPFMVGQDLPAIEFCPWCGADLQKKHPREVAAELDELRLQGEIVKSYLCLICNSTASRRFLARDLREGLAEELLKA